MGSDDAPAVQRPLPEVTPLSAPFWTAAREHRLVLQRCSECRRYQFPPEPACVGCSSDRIGWVEVSGRGTLYSWTVCYPPLLPYFAERAPWAVAAVQLEEGPRMVTRLPSVPVAEYAIGMPLSVGFEEIDGDITLVVFRRA